MARACIKQSIWGLINCLVWHYFVRFLTQYIGDGQLALGGRGFEVQKAVKMLTWSWCQQLTHFLCALHHSLPCNNLTDASHPSFRWIMDGKCKMYFQSLLCSGNNWELSELGFCIAKSYRNQVASSRHTSRLAQFLLLAYSQKQMLAERGNEERSHAAYWIKAELVL